MGCPVLSTVDLPSIAYTCKHVLTEAMGLLSANNVWECYHQVVHHSVCSRIISNVAWILLFQIMIGLFFFPISLWITRRYLEACWLRLSHKTSTGVKIIESESSSAAESEEDSDWET